MFTERETVFMYWLYDRLKYVHCENENYDYMHKLKEIIEKYRAGLKEDKIEKIGVREYNIYDAIESGKDIYIDKLNEIIDYINKEV